MWNFAGRQNDEQGHGNNLEGNWISGISFLDAIRLGPQRNLPVGITSNKSNNTYYLLPFLLGLLGMMFLYNRLPKQFVVILLLFILTGLAIVVYLNQTPYQPRERDYAYAGSFYAFAIYIGLGVFAIMEWLKKIAPTAIAASVATILTLVMVPGVMAMQNWDDHDRSGRYTARDLAKNYLSSCAPNAILFTYGDNDTFPLWYAQEVEGFRTDIRVVNLSLLGTDWYINQMKKKAYESEPVPFSFTSEMYEQGTRDVLPVLDRSKEVVLLKDVMDFVASNDPRATVETQDGGKMNYIPAKNVAVLVDSLKVIKSGMVKKEMIDSIVPAIVFNIDKKYVTKSDMMVLDLIAHFNWDRPVYFASSVGTENYMNLQNYFQLEGFAYRLVPFRTAPENEDIGYVNTDILYDNMMNKFVWGRMYEPDVLIETHNLRVLSIMKVRETFLRLANALIKENKNEKAIEVLDRMIKVTPHAQVPYDYNMPPVAEAYYKLGQIDKANKIIETLATVYESNLDYYLSLKGNYSISASYDTKISMSVMQELVSLTEKYKQEELFFKISRKFDVYVQNYMSKQPKK